MTDHTPPPGPPQDWPPVRSLADLERHWLWIKGPWGFSQPQLFCQLFDPDGAVLPQIVNITECPRRPDPAMIGSLLSLMTQTIDEVAPGGSLGAMYARPGDGQLREPDRAWARTLSTAGAEASIRVWPVFLATDVGVRIASPDDLAA